MTGYKHSLQGKINENHRIASADLREPGGRFSWRDSLVRKRAVMDSEC